MKASEQLKIDQNSHIKIDFKQHESEVEKIQKVKLAKKITMNQVMIVGKLFGIQY